METNLKINNEITLNVTDILRRLGVPADTKGRHYLKDAIVMACEDFDNPSCVTKSIYAKLADRYDTTASIVERAIRHTIEVAWGRGDINAFNEYFGYMTGMPKYRPTNSEFILRIADSVRLREKV